jgi:thiol:disulfide interchange protein DsbA
MNCDTIDSILDEHRLARLSGAERHDVAAHLERCGRCAGAAAAHEALACEPITEAPSDLFGKVLGQLTAASSGVVAQQRRRRMLASAAAAAAAVVLAAVAGFLALDGGVGSDEAVTPPVAVSDPPAPPRFVAGRDYEVLAAATPLAATADGVPVTEFFMYLCFPCAAVEPELESYRTAALGRVALTRVPAVFNSEAELHARAFYAAEELGELDAMHAAFYDEIHVRGNRLASRAALAAFFARFGVDGPAFAAAFDSPRVEARLQQALALAREYGIDATPSLVVAGRYKTTPAMAGSALFPVVDELVVDAACHTRCDGAFR